MLKRLQWRFEWLGQALIGNLVGRLPGPWVFRLGDWIGGIVWHFIPHRRITVLRNLRIAFAGEKPLDELQVLAKASFRRSCANLFSIGHTARLSVDELHQILHFENPELVEEACAKGRGLVLLLAHMGNWELLSRLTHFLPKNIPIAGFYRPLNNELLNASIIKRRQADGARMFSKGDPFHQACRFLRDGGLIGILADQRVGRQGEVVPFFGRFTRTSPLPSLLARRTRCEVLALSMASDGPGRWKARFSKVESPPTTAHCMAALEKAMASSPIDVFWLQERWRCQLGKRRAFKDWLGPETPRSDKAHRFLLWLADAPIENDLPKSWIHPDVDHEVVIHPGQAMHGDYLSTCRAHTCLANANQKTIQQLITAIDLAGPVPLDGVVTIHPSPALEKACKHAGIPLFKIRPRKKTGAARRPHNDPPHAEAAATQAIADSPTTDRKS